jgi:hypothetical protein|tara:strand:- start:998 stop:1225 length:228 start_codon:yes stop_codon:yes gene_type:complete
MDNMVLLVEYKNVYGNELVYPVNAKAKAIARLAGSKTLTPQAIRIAKELGFRVEGAGTTIIKVRINKIVVPKKER